MEPLTGYPRDVFLKLVEIVDTIANERATRMFYIGRCVDPRKRMLEHGSDIIYPIYYTESVDHAITVEDALINHFYDYQKCDNDAPHGGGGVSEEYGNYVYVAAWFK
jgi:hypothetical protein